MILIEWEKLKNGLASKGVAQFSFKVMAQFRIDKCNKEEIAQKDKEITQKDKEITESKEVTTQKDESLIKSAIALKHAGLSNEEIANITSLSVDVIKNLK